MFELRFTFAFVSSIVHRRSMLPRGFWASLTVCIIVGCCCLAAGPDWAEALGDDASDGRLAAADAAAWLEQLSEPARRGYRNLTERTYLPADLDEDVFETIVNAAAADSPALPDGR